MPLDHSIFLFLTAFVAGVLNSVAGGGGFLAFPALIFVGVPPIQANATNTAALWPGTIASAGAYRGAMSAVSRKQLVPVIVAGVLGGLAGALILLRTPQVTFLNLVPWMLLGSTIVFALSNRIVGWLRSRTAKWKYNQAATLTAVVMMQLIVAVYIGFFGAGAGIMMLAMFALMGVQSIHAMNGLKSLMAGVCNGVALVTFVIAHAVYWPHAIVMLFGAAIGGYGGAYYAQKLPTTWIRQIVIVAGAMMSLYFFLR